MERDLRALAGGADEKKDSDSRNTAVPKHMPRERLRGHATNGLQRAGNVIRVLRKKANGRGAGLRGQEENQHDAHHEAPIADAVCDERFLRRVPRLFAVDVIANEEIRAEAHAFPADKHQQEIVGQHECQHRKHKQVQKREEAVEARVFMHVANCEDVYEEPDKGNEQRIGPA